MLGWGCGLEALRRFGYSNKSQRTRHQLDFARSAFFPFVPVVPHSPVFSFLLPTNLVVAGSTKVCVWHVGGVCALRSHLFPGQRDLSKAEGKVRPAAGFEAERVWARIRGKATNDDDDTRWDSPTQTLFSFKHAHLIHTHAPTSIRTPTLTPTRTHLLIHAHPHSHLHAPTDKHTHIYTHPPTHTRTSTLTSTLTSTRTSTLTSTRTHILIHTHTHTSPHYHTKSHIWRGYVSWTFLVSSVDITSVEC